MKSLFLQCAALGASFAAGETLQTRQANVLTVDTTSGLVTGHSASNVTGVSEYFGIPFAKPPVGELRFAPPEAFISNSSINGTNFGFACLTITTADAAGGTGSLNIIGANITASGLQILATLGQLLDKFDENCLTLNVWVPSGGEEKKAVLLWIYGGGFTTGSTSTPEYNGKYLAQEQDVIVVSVNYRLNIFGFPGNPAEPNINLGLLDQRLGIEWTRDNIAAFGGDPSRITIFGQSAGSASVDYYSYAYTSDPIVAGLIQESGTVNGFGSSTAENAASSWFNVTSRLGCGNASSNANDVVECMRTKNATSILSSIPFSGSSNTASANFGPAIDNITVFSDYPARSSSGNFIKVPLLIGNADYEAGLFAAIDALSNITEPQSFWDDYDTQVFTCPAGVRANISIQNDVPTWRYRWFGSFPNTKLTSVPDSGAWHSSEVLIIFDTVPSGSGFPAETEEEAAIGTYLRGAWATFAKNPKEGLKGYGGGWPLYDPGKDTLVRLSYQNKTGTNLVEPAMYDVGCNSTFTFNGTGSGESETSTAASSGGISASATSSRAASTSAKANKGAGFEMSAPLIFLHVAAMGFAYLYCG